MTWTTAVARNYLDGGGVPVTFLAFVAKPLKHQNNQKVTMAYWTGSDSQFIDVGSGNYAFEAVGSLLTSSPVKESSDTNVRRHGISIRGIREPGRLLYREYGAEQAPAELHMVLKSTGGVILGAFPLIRGKIDGLSLVIDADKGDARLDIQLTTEAMQGTRVMDAKKSDSAFRQDRDGDTAMEYASLKDAEGDTWL